MLISRKSLGPITYREFYAIVIIITGWSVSFSFSCVFINNPQPNEKLALISSKLGLPFYYNYIGRYYQWPNCYLSSVIARSHATIFSKN